MLFCMSLATTQKGTRRIAANALAMLFVVAQMSAGFHLAVVEHETCEHGETIHAGHGETETHRASGAILAAASADNITTGEHEGVTLEAHDHCDVSVRENAAPSDVSFVDVKVAMLSTGGDFTVATPFATWWDARPQYEVAPKQSPPTAVL